MPMLAVEVVIATTRATVNDQRVATAPTSGNVGVYRIFAPKHYQIIGAGLYIVGGWNLDVGARDG